VGVVLIRCEGCDNLHLIADNLGWFRDEGVNIEQLMKEKGKKVYRYVTKETMEFITGDKMPTETEETVVDEMLREQ
jgi:mitochondrial protein import protein ZIM17